MLKDQFETNEQRQTAGSLLIQRQWRSSPRTIEIF